jgi:MFS family permease
MFATTFTATILTVSLDRVARDLNSTPSVIAWVITAPMLAGAVAMPILGRLGDIRGHRRVYLSGFSLAIVFSVLTAVARNPAWLISARTLAQLAGSATVPASFAMLFRSFPPGERVRASAWSSATLSGASVTGLVVGGPIIDSIGWRPLFLIQAGLSMVALLAAVVVLRPDERRSERIRLDTRGAALLAITAFCATFGINRLAEIGPTPWVIGMLVVTPVGAWLLVRVERAAQSPLLPMKLVRDRNIRAAAASSFAIGASWIGSFAVTPLLLESVLGYSATDTSLITLCRTGTIVLAAPAASRLGTRFGERRILIVAAMVTAGGMLLLSLGAWSESLGIIVAALLLSGWAFGHAQPAMVAVMANAADESDFGLATSLQQTANQMGSVFGLGLVTAIAADATTPGPFARTYFVTAAFAVVGAVIASRVTSSERFIATGLVGEDDSEQAVVVEEEFRRRAPIASER